MTNELNTQNINDFNDFNDYDSYDNYDSYADESDLLDRMQDQHEMLEQERLMNEPDFQARVDWRNYNPAWLLDIEPRYKNADSDENFQAALAQVKALAERSNKVKTESQELVQQINELLKDDRISAKSAPLLGSAEVPTFEQYESLPVVQRIKIIKRLKRRAEIFNLTRLAINKRAQISKMEKELTQR